MLMGLKLQRILLFATESRAEIKRIFNDYFRSGWFSGRGIACRKTGLSTSVYQKIYLGRYCCKTFHQNTFFSLLTHPFRKISRKYKATGFVYSYN